jgi:hypothetical protein
MGDDGGDGGDPMSKESYDEWATRDLCGRMTASDLSKDAAPKPATWTEAETALADARAAAAIGARNTTITVLPPKSGNRAAAHPNVPASPVSSAPPVDKLPFLNEGRAFVFIDQHEVVSNGVFFTVQSLADGELHAVPGDHWQLIECHKELVEFAYGPTGIDKTTPLGKQQFRATSAIIEHLDEQRRAHGTRLHAPVLLTLRRFSH